MDEQREKLIEEIGDLALEYDMNYIGCSQSVLAALQEKLDLKDPGAFKAASALAGGIAKRGETCGALIGGMMAICQIVGRESIEDTEQYRKSFVPSAEMYLKFKEEIGHTLCAEIHKILYGRSFKLYEQEEYEAFLVAGGHEPEGCPGVCGRAAKIAARIILDLKAGKG
jgi:C_GCAxxG_C_C family probable redox protein